MDSIRSFLEEVMTFHVDVVLLGAAVLMFLVGAVLIYKKGIWPGLPICLSSILLVVIAALAKFFSS